MGKCACFVEGTLVLTEKGMVAIEEVSLGDKVWSENPYTGESGYKMVVETFVNQTNILVELNFAKENITTTVNHPFWVIENEWRNASELRAGDIVKNSKDEWVEILGTRVIHLEKPIPVYNFEVEDWHTYFVGCENILVHNMCAKEFIKSPKNAKQVIKYLKKQGFEIVRKNGSHTILKDGLNTVVVPDHGAKEIAIGTLKSIMKQAGLM